MRIAYIWSRGVPSRQTDSQQVVKTVDGLAQAGADVDLIVPIGVSTLRKGLEAHDAEVRRFYSVKADFRLRGFLGVEPSKHELERASHPLISAARLVGHDYDVIHTRLRSFFLIAVAAGWPVIFETYRLMDRDHPHLTRTLSKLAARDNLLGIITHSEPSRQSLLAGGFPESKLAIIHNGYDPAEVTPRLTREEARRQLGIEADAKIVTYTGHIRAAKGMDAILDMAALTPDVRYLIVGGMPEHQREFGAELARRGLDNVSQEGWKPTSELPPYLYAADLLIIPPTARPLHHFGRTVLPMKVFSYIAMGRPILAPELPDIAEVLQDGRNARLVQPDAPQAAVTALREILDDAELATTLAEGALESAKGLSWRARGEKILDQIEIWR